MTSTTALAKPRSRWSGILIGVGLFALAFAVRWFPMFGAAGLYPVDTYDPSVYYAAAVGLWEGRIPYRDFLLLHPPGLLVFLQPFAALGGVIGDPLANLLARITFMAMGAATTVLIYVLLAKRGIVPALLGAGFYATFFPAIYTERSTRLEGLGSLLLIVALLLLAPAAQHGKLTRGRLIAVGALLGYAATVKVWGVVFVAVVCLWLWASEGFRNALIAGLGALATIVVVIGPFAVLAGSQLWRMVILDQTGRPEFSVNVWRRLGDIIGLGQLRDSPAPDLVPALLLVVVVLAAVGAARSRLGQLYLMLLIMGTITLMSGPSWFLHYPTFTAVPLALVLGTGLAEVTDRLGRGGRVAVGALVAAAVAAGTVTQLSIPQGSAFPVKKISAAVAKRSGCITTDNPVSLILTDTLRRNLKRGCPLVVDLSGAILDITRGTDSDTERSVNRDFQAAMMNYLSSGDTTVIMHLWPNAFSSTSQVRVESWPVLEDARGCVVRAPRR